MKRAEKAYRALQSNDGTTMVELIVAFVVVMIAITFFTTSISVAIRMYQNSIVALDNTQRFEENYFQNRKNAETEANITLVFKDRYDTAVLTVPAELKVYEETGEDTYGVRYWIE